MLKFYYHPLSPLARRVWLTLLEKQLPFSTQTINLMGEQFEPEFLALNPFHHVPVVEDGDVRLIESLAIIDYLEAAYPAISLTSTEPATLGKMRMIQMVVANELIPTIVAVVAAAVSDSDFTKSKHRFEQMQTAFQFLDQQLGAAPYMLGEQFSIADIVAGAAVPLFQRLGVSLAAYPALADWSQRISDRPAWQQTRPGETEFVKWKKYVNTMMRRQQKLANRIPAATAK